MQQAMQLFDKLMADIPHEEEQFPKIEDQFQLLGKPLIKLLACFFSPSPRSLLVHPFLSRKVRGYVDVRLQAKILRYTAFLDRVSRPLAWMRFHVERETGKFGKFFLKIFSSKFHQTNIIINGGLSKESN